MNINDPLASTLNRHYEITITDNPISYDLNQTEVDQLEMEQSENVYIPNLEGLTPPRTAHVFINLSTEKFSEKILVKALHDSGCAKTIIHKRVLKNIPGFEDLELT
jgi:hypothetical protein